MDPKTSRLVRVHIVSREKAKFKPVNNHITLSVAAIAGALIEAKRVLPAKRWRFMPRAVPCRFQARSNSVRIDLWVKWGKLRPHLPPSQGRSFARREALCEAAKVLFVAWQANPDVLKDYMQ